MNDNLTIERYPSYYADGIPTVAKLDNFTTINPELKNYFLVNI